MDKDNRRESVLASIHGRPEKCAGRTWQFYRSHRVVKSDNFRCARTRVGIHSATKKNIRLRFASNDKGRFRGCGRSSAERPSSGICYLCVHCYISALRQTDDAKETEVTVHVLSFLQTTISRISKWEPWPPSPWELEWRPMRDGLGSNNEFEGAEIDAWSAGSQWVSLLVVGTLGRNNALRLAHAKQASALRRKTCYSL